MTFQTLVVLFLPQAPNQKIKWLQAVGRGLRRSEGLEDCLILDHGGITERLGFPDDIEEYFYELDDGKKEQIKKKAAR